MPRCCGGNSCSCLIQAAGDQTTVSGSGSASDPYIISSNAELQVADSTVFNLTLTGSGTASSPWVLSTAFAATATLDDIPDVVITGVTNTQVLGWDSATSKWTNRAATTAASGSVTHDTSMSGDGSGGLPLQINEDPNGFLVTAATGLGLSDVGKNRIIRHYGTSGARAVSTPAPDLNTLTMLDSVPGRIDYWTGTVWAEYGQFNTSFVGQQFAMSGAYTAGVGKLSLLIRQVSTTTDASGYFDVLSTADLTGRAGVLGAWFQPTLSNAYAAVLENGTTSVRGRAYRLTDGSSLSTQSVAGVVFAVTY